MNWRLGRNDGKIVMRTWETEELPDGIRCEMVDSRSTNSSLPENCRVKVKVWKDKDCTEPYCNVFGNIPDATEWVDNIVNMLEVMK